MAGRVQTDFSAPAPVFAQWYGMLIGPVVFGLDLLVSYALVPHACSTGHHYVLHVMTAVCLAILLSGFLTSWGLYHRIPGPMPERADKMMLRARFMAIAGMMLCAFSIVLVIANEWPRLFLHPCD